jgi:outer membrane protein TolC
VLEVLIADVVERHPSVAAAAAAWRAAAERYPQAVSLDDPMLDLMVAPASLGSNDVDFAYVVQGRQKLPWHGKRPLRGQVATHQAQAAAFEVADARLALVEVTSLAYFDYYLARRRLSLNAQNQKTVADLRSTALSRYENQLVSQQDVLLADVDAAELAQRQVDLEQSQRVAMARINTLLLRLPLAPLPDPPSVLPRIAAIAPVEVLAERAFSQRPDLAAAWKRLRADQAGVALAWREYKPDLELVGRYDTFWQAPEQQLQGQVGLTLNVPLARDRRRAAVREAGALVGQRRAEIDRLVAQISLEIQSAFERAEAARKSLDILRQRILPAAESSFATANSSYVSGTIDFLRVVEAQRQLLMFRDRFVEAEVALHIRVAELERVLAGPILWLENPVVPQR